MYFHTLCRIYTIRNDESIKIYYSSTVITQHKVLHIYKRGFGGEAPEKNFGVLNNPPPLLRDDFLREGGGLLSDAVYS